MTMAEFVGTVGGFRWTNADALGGVTSRGDRSPWIAGVLLAGLVVAGPAGCGGGDDPADPDPAAGDSPGTGSGSETGSGGALDLDTGADADGAAAPIFRDVAPSSGLEFAHFSGVAGGFLFPEILGSGVALFDYDGDGDLDVFLMQGDVLDPERPVTAQMFPLPSGQAPGHRLFRNDLGSTGELAFTDVTDAAGLARIDYGMGVATGDYDNDGDVDLYLTNMGSNVLYRNEGDGTFQDVTEASGTDVPTWSTSASWFDHDQDGDLDLFVVDYVAWSSTLDQVCTSASGNRDYCGPQNYRSLQDHLFRNNGDGTFDDISGESGIGAGRGAGLGVTAADFNGDALPDVFVANDGEANMVWINQGDGTYAETGLMSGAALNRSGTAEASMGVTAGDYDGDGDEDLFMTHLINETNTLYQNDGTGFFSDVSARSGLGSASRTMTGFGSAFFDFDNDGHLDVFVANGNVKVDEFREGSGDYPFDQRNQLFRNGGSGRFTEVEAAGGDATGLSFISRGVAFGDLDNDGDVDMLLTNNSGPARLLLNEVGTRNPWIQLQLVGTDSPADASGARVAVHRTDRTPIWRRVHTDGSYLSASDPRLTIGLGDDPAIEAVHVHWPSGRRESWAGLDAGRLHRLVEGEGVPSPASD
ncbi:MAG: CRTAC1 family protein [Phycisphaerales bacterium]